MTEPPRPDPDDLLRRVEREERRGNRGKLRLFLGFAPGVGKTFRMLQVARELAAQGVDLVVGVVETHRRQETEAMALGLEVLPRRKVEYRGRTLDEFDLDGALRRQPRLLLVDELAHTNAPGSRHPKRWQDVHELLHAGIDVLSTMNIQHLESLNDVVAQITRVQVRETVPDSVLDQADAVELVDLSPDELLLRLREGKVYLPEQARRATEHFFQRGNLLALRELALRRTAQRVDEEVQEYRAEHGVLSTWPAGERILVCVGPAPSSGRLIRAAARMAAGLRCPWVAGSVETGAGLTEAARERLDAHLRLAESLGGTTVRLSGTRVSEALLAHARRHNVTRILLGKPTHARLRDWIRGSLVEEVVRGSEDIEVHVIGPGTGPTVAPPGDHVAPGAKGLAPGALGRATLVVAAALGLALLLRRAMSLPDLEMIFLLAVMVSATWLGRLPAIFTAALGVACYDFFFVPPLYTFSVHDRRYFLTFAMMFAIGLVVSSLAARLRRQEQDAIAREEKTATLYALLRELTSAAEPRQIAAISARHALQIFEAQTIVLGATGGGELEALGSAPEGLVLGEKEGSVARWCHEQGAWAGRGTDTLPGAPVLCVPLLAGAIRVGVMAVFPAARALRVDERAFLDIFCRQVAAALSRVQLAEEARAAALRARAEELRSTLLSAVSHDLRTPLASITGSATVLRDDPGVDERTRGELLEAVVEQAARLERLVSNLLDMTRLDSGGSPPKREWVPLEEVIGSVLVRPELRMEERPVTVEIGPEVPLLHVDPVLLGQVLVNILENVNKYTPARSPVEIEAQRGEAQVWIEVRDRGPGLPPGSELQVFEKFFRAAQAGGSGAGLGLAICKGMIEAHGGRISAANRSTGGAAFRIVLPCDGSPPPIEGDPP